MADVSKAVAGSLVYFNDGVGLVPAFVTVVDEPNGTARSLHVLSTTHVAVPNMEPEDYPADFASGIGTYRLPSAQ